MISKEAALNAPMSELPHLARRVLVDEIRKLVRGTDREAEVMEWASTWPARDEALALLEELREAKGRLPAQPIEVALKVHRQATERAIEAINDAAHKREAQRRREIYAVVLHHAIEQKYAWQQEERTLRHDPMGLWGAPNYKGAGED
jgi:hypothetical protein